MKSTNNIFFTLIICSLICSYQPVESKTMKNTNLLTKFITKKNGIKEYQLSNGLKILLKQDQSIPLLTFSVWYKTGSRNETKGSYGLAHFLEHMMFKGTNKYKKGEISETIQSLGGIYNAFTSTDCTAYYETVSPKYLEKVMEIESSRFKDSLLDENELKLERSVVLSELEGNLNNPVTLLDQKLRYEAYDISSYKHPTIGYEEDIKSIDSTIMRDFYKRYYNPKNAFIVLVGDFEAQKALDLIERYFGSIRNDEYTSDPELTLKDESQKKERKLTVKRSGSFKVLEIGYHIPAAKDKDIYPLNILEEILIKGENSPLNKSLIETGLATEVYGGAEVNADPGLFYILVSLTPKATHKKVENIILNEIDKLIKNPPDEQTIVAAKNRIKASYLFGLDGSLQQVINLGYFESISSWQESIEWVNKISKVSKEEMQNSLDKYFKKENRTIGYFIPKLEKGARYEPQPLGLSKTQHYKKESTIQNVFNYEKQILKDGSDLLLYKNIDLPITYISGIIKGGFSLLPKEKELDCEIISRTLEKGSKNYTKEEVKNILDSTGSYIYFACDEESFKFNIVTLNDNLHETVKLFSDIFTKPTFPSNEIKNEVNKLIAETIESKDNTQEIARRRFNQVIYTKEHPYYSNTFEEDIKLLKKINSKDLANEHKKIISENKAIISIVTNLNKNELSKSIALLENDILTGKIKAESKINIPDTLLRDTPRLESIQVKDKLQSDVFLGHAGKLKRTDPDFYKMHVANYILGGSSLSSRLSKKVRDESGLVYTIYSYINASHGRGEFGIYFGSNNNNVDKAIKLTKEELHRFVKDGITEEELKKAKAALIDSFISRNLSTKKNLTNTILGIEFYNLGENYIHDYPQIINSLKLDEINTVIKKHVFPDKLNIVIAGEYTTNN